MKKKNYYLILRLDFGKYSCDFLLHQYTICKTILKINKYKIQNTDNNKCKTVEQQELSLTSDRNTEWYSHFGRQCGSYLQN